jgi:hypothetical protein
LRAAALYDFNNRALDVPATRAMEALAPFIERSGGRVPAVALEGQFYLGDLRIQVPPGVYQFVHDLEAILLKRGVGGLAFETGLSAEELRRFAHVFQTLRTVEGTESAAHLHEALRFSGIRHVHPAQPMRLEVSGGAEGGGDPRVGTTLTYAKAVSVLSQLLADPSGQERLRRRHLTRIVQQIADCASDSLELLLGLTQFAAKDGDRARLAVDACVVAVALGHGMGLERAIIADLGVAALQLADPEQAEVSAGGPPPEPAFRQLLEAPHWSASLLRRALAQAQRAQPVRGSAGLPRQHRLASILRVAHDYVALTHGVPLVPGKPSDALPPLDALGRIYESPPHVYDRLVVAQLVKVVGMYPVGTLVVLSDTRQAYVVGRDKTGQPILRLREGASRFGERLPLHATGAAIAGVLTQVDAAERAAAVLGDEAAEKVREAGLQVHVGSTLGRVAVQRVAVRRPKP